MTYRVEAISPRGIILYSATTPKRATRWAVIHASRIVRKIKGARLVVVKEES